MLSISYDAIYSRFLSKVQAYDLMEEVTEDIALELMNEWISSVKSNPRVRKLFSSLSLDSDNRSLSFELKYSEDDNDDVDFVTELFGFGVAWKWVEPKYQSVLNQAQFFGGKEQSYFSQANHMSQLKLMNDSARLGFYNLIRDHGYYKNSYLEGGM